MITTERDGRVELTTMAGQSLHHRIRADPTHALDDIGTLVATLHDQTIARWLPVREPDDPETWIATIRRSPTRHLLAIERVARELPAVSSVAEVLVHGDLHDKNILCDAGHRALIDLDGLALGAPEEDLANLAVHLELRNLQARSGLTVGARSGALYRSYERMRPLDHERLIAFERHTWFRLACIYQYRTPSSHLVPLLLHAAQGVRS